MQVARHVENAELEPDCPRGDVERTELHASAGAGEIDGAKLEASHCVGDVVDKAEVEDGEIVDLSITDVDHRAEHGVQPPFVGGRTQI